MSWFQKTEKEASGAKSYAVASEIILNRLPELLHMYQHISTMCIDMVGRDEITIPDGGLHRHQITSLSLRSDMVLTGFTKSKTKSTKHLELKLLQPVYYCHHHTK